METDSFATCILSTFCASIACCFVFAAQVSDKALIHDEVDCIKECATNYCSDFETCANRCQLIYEGVIEE